MSIHSRRTQQSDYSNTKDYDGPHVLHDEHSDADHGVTEVEFPNRWARIRAYIREPASEFFGTMILIIFGNGVNLQVVLSNSPKVYPTPGSAKGIYLSISFGWAVGTALGVWVASISGGHINPAVTIAQATFRRFPWKKVPVYVGAQALGAFCGAALMYANYIHPLDLYEGGRNIRSVPGTAALFSTYAADYMTNVSCFFSEFLATAVLLIVVLAITDKKNGPPPAGLVPLVLFITILGEGACLGMETAYALNPARDFGPRLFTYVAGYGREVWNYRSQYWLWCPILGPITGALAGTLAYDLFMFTGDESIINRPSASALRHRERAEKSARGKVPAGVDNV